MCGSKKLTFRLKGGPDEELASWASVRGRTTKRGEVGERKGPGLG